MVAELMKNIEKSSLPKGFTLVEILVTTVVIAIGCLGVLNLQTMSLRSGSMADQGTVAAFLAESKLEALRAVPFTDLDAGKTTMVCTREGACCDKTGSSACVGINPDTNADYPKFPYEIATTIISGEPTSFSKRIEIQITWNDVYGKRSLSYDAAVTNLAFQ